jgi:tetratricopeptide (TPR) repeat protein
MIERWAYTAGSVLMDADPARALQSFEVFERWAAGELGPADPVVAQAVARQGWCQARLGRRAESEGLYSRALRLLETTAGPGHPASSQLVTYLAALHAPDGASHAPAPPRTLAGLPPFSPFGPDGITDASLAAEQERLEDAARRAGRPSPGAEAGRAGEADREHGFVAGRMLAEIGEFELAGQAFEDFGHWANRQYGPEHPSVLEAVRQLAYCQSRLGNHVEACRLYQRVRQMLTRTDSGSHALGVLAGQIAYELFEIGRALTWQERPGEALSAFQVAQAWVGRECGPQEPLLTDLLVAQAWCQVELGDEQAARQLYERARERCLPADPFRAELTAYLKEGSPP